MMKSLLKYTLLLFCGCAVLMPAGCGKQPLDDIDTPQDVIDAKNPADVAPDVTPGTETLTVSIEPSGSIATKTTYDSVDGKFAWSEGDWIAIHYSNGEYVRGTIQADGTEGSKVVTVTPPANATRDYYALYPYGMLYNSSVRLDTDMTDNYGNPDLYVQFLSGCYDLVETMGGYGSFDEVPCPLVARNDPESGVLLFRHVGGLLHVKMPLLDQNSVCVLFTFDKDVTGIYKVADPDTDHPTVTTKGTTTNNQIWVHLDGSGNGMGCRSSSEPVSINIALPCGTYNNIKVEILSSEPNQVQESATIPHLTITRGHGKRINFADFCDRQLTSAYVPGKFSVSDTKSVYFASGNLRVNASVSPREWAFEKNQWDFNASGTFDAAYISHFGWGTGDVPEKSSDGYSDYLNYTNWGIHFDDLGNGSEAGTGTNVSWYVLSGDEWNYLWNRSDGSKRALAQIYIAAENRTVNGMILLPDDWVIPGGCSFNAGSTDYTSNKYTTGTNAAGYDGLWSPMEAAGAVFLPVCGNRVGSTSFNGVGDFGYYWSSGRGNDYNAFSIMFGNSSEGVVYEMFDIARILGCSVRLVHD